MQLTRKGITRKVQSNCISYLKDIFNAFNNILNKYDLGGVELSGVISYNFNGLELLGWEFDDGEQFLIGYEYFYRIVQKEDILELSNFRSTTSSFWYTTKMYHPYEYVVNEPNMKMRSTILYRKSKDEKGKYSPILRYPLYSDIKPKSHYKTLSGDCKYF